MRIKTIKMLTYIVLSFSLYSCHDTVPFERVTMLKTGMTINEVGFIMEKTIIYKYINDSTEKRKYVFDNPQGHDTYINVTYVNGIATQINH